jgi:hypothetical protein
MEILFVIFNVLETFGKNAIFFINTHLNGSRNAYKLENIYKVLKAVKKTL